MPALVAFGRTWEFGSDDLFFPALISTLFRMSAFIGILGGTLYFREALTCQDSHLLSGLAGALLCMLALITIIEACITGFSARGTIVRTKPRAPIVHLLHFRFLLFLIEVVLLIIGTVFAYVSQTELPSNTDCPDLFKAVLLVQLSVAANWILIVFLVAAIFIYLDPCHCYSAKVNYNPVARRVRNGDIDETVVETQWRLSHSVWEKRFKVVCCVAGRDETHHLAYREVAEMFAHMFCDTNVVLSDLAAGFILLQREHLAKEARLRTNGRNDETEADGDNMLASFDFNFEEDRVVFKNLLHYIKYALGMYTWPFYIYQNLLCGVCKLCYHLKCGERSRYSNVHKDYGCMCHLTGLQQITELNDVDIVYASFENSLFKVPFLVCLDHEMQSIVIAFRGTLSFQDVVTDLTASTKPIPLPNYPDFLVHKGMLKTVQSVMEELEENGCLETAFNRASSYKLVIVGHSLGSGCACILSILLKQKYPDLTCYCYSPTGALLNEAAAIFTEDFVTSVTLGKDFAARLNFANTVKLKSDLVRVLESCRKPKCQILMEGILETLSNCFGRSLMFEQHSQRHRRSPSPTALSETDGDEDQEEHSPLVSEEAEENLKCRNRIRVVERTDIDFTPLIVPHLSSLALPVRSTIPSPENSLNELQAAEQRLIPLYPPGRIIHLVYMDSTKRCFCDSRQVVTNWCSRYSFDSIDVSPEMFRDHLPDVLSNTMNKVWKEKMKELDDNAVGRPFDV